MASPISPLGVRGPVQLVEPLGVTRGNGSFQQVLEGAMQSVEGLRQNAQTSVEKVLTGESEELHQTVLATQRAELAFEMFLQVRNKVVQAYQEIMRTQL